ncbi:helix-turn-helix domain-containing protein [Lysobacter xanthus]
MPNAPLLLDVVLRTAGASLLLLTALALLASAPRLPVSRAFLAFALGLAGFLGVNTAFDAADLPSPLWDVASFASRMAVIALWLFCLVLFQARVRTPAVVAATLAWLGLVVASKGYLAPPPRVDLSALQIALGSGLLLHAGWHVLRDLRGDLVERRRRARPVFALALLALVASDFAMDLLHGYRWQPERFLMLQNGAIAVLAAGLGVWLLRADPWGATPVAARAREAVPDPDAAVLARVQAVMREARPWLDADLTFAAFAAQVGVPEPALRRAINHRLGHGHFRNFVNEYRVAEAKRRLRDPAFSGEKILAIALDSGFASLASFNRAFKQATGQAPSAYRAAPSDVPAGPEPQAS